MRIFCVLSSFLVSVVKQSKTLRRVKIQEDLNQRMEIQRDRDNNLGGVKISLDKSALIKP